MKMSAVKDLTFFSLHGFSFTCKFSNHMSSFVCLISYLFYIYISVVILVLLKMYVGTYETSSLSFFSYQKCVYISLCLSPQFAFCFDDFKT